jgi:hypothetical protein
VIYELIAWCTRFFISKNLANMASSRRHWKCTLVRRSKSNMLQVQLLKLQKQLLRKMGVQMEVPLEVQLGFQLVTQMMWLWRASCGWRSDADGDAIVAVGDAVDVLGGANGNGIGDAPGVHLVQDIDEEPDVVLFQTPMQMARSGGTCRFRRTHGSHCRPTSS